MNKRPPSPLSRAPNSSLFDKQPTGKTEIICLCNCVSRQVIEDSIRGGAKTLNEIFDVTSAGVGPCGGSCRRRLQPMLDSFSQCGEFPEKIKEDKRGKRRR